MTAEKGIAYLVFTHSLHFEFVSRILVFSALSSNCIFASIKNNLKNAMYITWLKNKLTCRNITVKIALFATFKYF